MFWRIEIKEKEGHFDALGESAKRDINDLDLRSRAREVKTVQVYHLDGELQEPDIKTICEDLLIDPVTQEYDYSGSAEAESRFKVVEVAYNPGVMDPVEESTKKAILDLGIAGIRSVRTAKKYLIKGDLSADDIRLLAEKVLYNKLVQHVVKDPSEVSAEPPTYCFKLISVDLIKAADKRLKKISRDGQLFLDLEEMRTIKKYFVKLGRNPTDCELETIAQTWSEHCYHKTFRGLVKYNGKTIDNLLKNTVMKVTKKLKKKWCVSVFEDNSGVIRFDEKFNICFKVETHNHPSALEPYGGAGTGIGGVIRDPLGTGLGAKPIINTDVFCFGPPDHSYKKLPKGVLHPKRIMKGVVAGVRDYGNRMGIPTSNGAVLFDENFVGNPLVFCGNVGIMPRNKSFKEAHSGDLIVVVGGRTGRDGIHGATFSSGELTHESHGVSGSAVQIGNPIQEKKLVDTILQARDLNLYSAITDCGAGGLSSAVGEMGAELGAEVELEKVPLKYKGLRYDEIWISEAQERMVLAVPPEKIDALQNVFKKENVEATVIGNFTKDRRLRLSYDGNRVCDIDMRFLHKGAPRTVRKASWKRPRFSEPRIIPKKDLTGELLGLLSNPNIASKEWIIRQYDHEVQGGSVIKPLQGINGGGPGDACVTRPVLNSKKGIVLGCGINPDYGKIDPYWMAASVIDEALRQITSVGGKLDRCAILDNFCWGNTNKPDRLGGLVRAAEGCHDIALAYGVPFISGKDSLNNEYSAGNKSISIPPTLLISAIAIMDDVARAVTMDAKKSGNAIYIIGKTHDELGGSQYYKMKGYVGNNVPKVDTPTGKSIMESMNKAMDAGCVRSCHDCSEGGMAVALAEMAFAGGLGMEIDLSILPDSAHEDIKRDDTLLFSESNSRFIVEVENEAKFIKIMKGKPVFKLGRINKGKIFKIYGMSGDILIKSDVDRLKAAWQRPFKNM
ncbi:MAG: phosphoribosylformylglycinamidine synthase subunit PurL [Candidatus Omnitrophica bacterium]|nr:phosphoribosylformylglycinamidine synthase subunit PurL [Candidatus Omnitrophota bacterium]